VKRRTLGTSQRNKTLDEDPALTLPRSSSTNELVDCALSSNSGQFPVSVFEVETYQREIFDVVYFGGMQQEFTRLEKNS